MGHATFARILLFLARTWGKTQYMGIQKSEDGKWRRALIGPIKWTDGRMARFEMAIDIHNRKVAEESLRESESTISPACGDHERRIFNCPMKRD